MGDDWWESSYCRPPCSNFSFRKGQFKVAVEHYTRSLAKDPENTKTLSNRAACYHKLEQMDLCIQVRIRKFWCIFSYSGLQRKYCFGPSLHQAQAEEGFCSPIPGKVGGKLSLSWNQHAVRQKKDWGIVLPFLSKCNAMQWMVTRSQQVRILPAAPYKESAQTNGGLRMPQIKLKSKSDFVL